ncbi:permease-like cell division protein FtsX [Acidithiobacillus sulfuriphilus]|uniref:Cell division protein FtsX n=2 Tax=Acidithiobacillus sulfuriphilus TaxID=1867749 RepID=A0A3M8QR49_9PROT|nr:permease-like cell division protein FtsX [Acidithiobacillus sulfuriphilus]RNF58759.1 ABC transporter permease [Acidithiobacillus sulfuriphilus]
MNLHIRIEAGRNALSALGRQPISTAMTVLALAIVIALPVGLFTVLTNMENLLGNWRNQAQISLFLHKDASPQAIQHLQKALAQTKGVVEVRYVSADAALAEFQKHSGMVAAIQTLGENPLPASFVVQLDPLRYPPSALQQLIGHWAQDPAVATAQSDLHWVARLQAILALGQRAALILAVLLALGAVLVMGNTIRLHIAQRRDEIDVASLVGATRSFIRRPFLYQGLLQGAVAGLVAWGIVVAAFYWLQVPVDRLAALYGTQFNLVALTPEQGATLVIASALLGWLGSLLAVGRHLDHTFA